MVNSAEPGLKVPKNPPPLFLSHCEFLKYANPRFLEYPMHYVQLCGPVTKTRFFKLFVNSLKEKYLGSC